MSEIKSGIVLYPEGEIAPNIARQLGFVVHASELDREVVGGSVHAIGYDPQLVIEGLKLSYDEGNFNGFFMPPWNGDKIDKREQIQSELIEVARQHIVSDGLGDNRDKLILDGRRIDLIGPKVTPQNGLALKGFGSHINTYADIRSRSTFDLSAHPWVQGEEGFVLPLGSSDGLKFEDFRSEYFRGAFGNINERIVKPSSLMHDAVVGEVIKAKILNQHRSVRTDQSIAIQEQIINSTIVLDLRFTLPAGQETLDAMQKMREKLDAWDRTQMEEYEGPDGFNDGHWDMFGDYRPEPTSRQPVGDIASTIDPLDDPDYISRLN